MGGLLGGGGAKGMLPPPPLKLLGGGGGGWPPPSSYAYAVFVALFSNSVIWSYSVFSGTPVNLASSEEGMPWSRSIKLWVLFSQYTVCM